MDATSHHVSAADGLRLHYRDVGPRDRGGLPVVCLPGLTRTAEDYAPLAEVLARDDGDGPARRVLSLDFRGRGASDRDPDPAHDSVAVEADDVVAVLAAADVREAVFVGTSRGGLIIMALTAIRPEMIRGAVLNDIGPVLEPAGLERIRGYVGRLPAPRNWGEAVRLIQGYAGAPFTGLSDDDWRHFARTTFVRRDGRLAGRSDPALAQTLRSLDLSAPSPTLWPQFDGLRGVPLLVVRGGNSDLLSAETADAMRDRHGDGTLLTVPGQGHAPLLRDRESLHAISALARRCDAARGDAGGLAREKQRS